MPTSPNPTKAQVAAELRFGHLKTYVLKALSKKHKPMSAIITKLEDYAAKPRTPDFGNPSPTRVRKAMHELIAAGAAVQQGARRTAAYAKAA